MPATVLATSPKTPSGANFMISVVMPQGVRDDGDELSAILTAANGSVPLPPHPPSAALRSPSRTTFFFLDVSAQGPLVLQLRHPKARDHRQEITPRRGGVRELADIRLESKEAAGSTESATR